MNSDKWKEIKLNIKNTFGIDEEYEEELEPGSADVIEFNGPSGKMKVRFVTKPKMLDKKTSYSNRAGSAVKVDYVFSDTEFVSHMELYMWSDSDDEWKKMEAESIF